MDNNFWKKPRDVLDDFELLSDFYDPSAQVKWDITRKLPRSTRGRGTKISNSDTDEDETDIGLNFCGLNYNREDLKQVDVIREFEVQDALRKACGIGFSNRIIESHWGAEKIEPNIETRINAQDIQNDPVINMIESNEKKVANLLNVSNEVSNLCSDINNEVRRNGIRRTTYVHQSHTETRDNKQIEVENEHVEYDLNSNNVHSYDKANNDVNSFCGYYSDSSDENIIIETYEINEDTDSATINNKNDKKKNNRKRCTPVDIDIKLPTQKSIVNHNEYAKTPSEPMLNPNAKEFHYPFSNNSYNYDNSYKLASTTDFPPLS